MIVPYYQDQLIYSKMFFYSSQFIAKFKAFSLKCFCTWLVAILCCSAGLLFIVLSIPQPTVIQFYLVQCHNWNSNSPHWPSFSFILSSVTIEIVIHHTDRHNWNSNSPCQILLSFILSSVTAEIAILHTVDQFHLVQCQNWNSNFPCRFSLSFILSSVTTVIAILHTDRHLVSSCLVSELK